MKTRPDRAGRSFPGQLLCAACLTAVAVLASGCIVYSSPRCYFDKGDGIAVASLYFHPENATQLAIAYWKDGFVETLADGDALFCRRLEPEAHRRIMEILDSTEVAIDRTASFGEAMSYGPTEPDRPVPSRFLVYVQFDGSTRPSVVWWAPDMPTAAGHSERLDEVFCTFERELSFLRRTVTKYGAEFLEARGRERPCGEG